MTELYGFYTPGYVKCPKCGRGVKLTAKGKFYAHNIGGYSNQRHRSFYNDRCPASGTKPEEWQPSDDSKSVEVNDE